MPSYSRFQTNLLTRFVDKMCILFYTHPPYLLLHYKPSALQVRIPEKNALNANTNLQFTAAVPNYNRSSQLRQNSSQQGSETHSTTTAQFTTAEASGSVNVSSHSSSRTQVHLAAEWRTVAHTGLLGLTFRKFTRMENAHAVRKKTFVYIATGKTEHPRAFSSRYAHSSGVTRGLSHGECV